jgi:hypothetical protein
MCEPAGICRYSIVACVESILAVACMAGFAQACIYRPDDIVAVYKASFTGAHRTAYVCSAAGAPISCRHRQSRTVCPHQTAQNVSICGYNSANHSMLLGDLQAATKGSGCRRGQSSNSKSAEVTNAFCIGCRNEVCGIVSRCVRPVKGFLGFGRFWTRNRSYAYDFWALNKR